MDRHASTRVLLAVVALAALLFSSVYVYGTLTADPGVIVTAQTKEKVHPRDIADVQPQDVACNAEIVTVSDGTLGPFYRAVWGRFVLTWTSPLDKFVLTDGNLTDYPFTDQRTIQCLRTRAVSARNTQ